MFFPSLPWLVLASIVTMGLTSANVIYFQYAARSDCSDKCLVIRNVNLTEPEDSAPTQLDGMPVQINCCNASLVDGAQRWVMTTPGRTKIKVSQDESYCLDATNYPQNGVLPIISKCKDNTPSQQWYYTDDNRLAVENQGFCLDLENGDTSDGPKPVQIWKCTDYNTNQIWNIGA